MSLHKKSLSPSVSPRKLLSSGVSPQEVTQPQCLSPETHSAPVSLPRKSLSPSVSPQEVTQPQCLSLRSHSAPVSLHKKPLSPSVSPRKLQSSSVSPQEVTQPQCLSPESHSAPVSLPRKALSPSVSPQKVTQPQCLSLRSHSAPVPLPWKSLSPSVSPRKLLSSSVSPQEVTQPQCISQEVTQPQFLSLRSHSTRWSGPGCSKKVISITDWHPLWQSHFHVLSPANAGRWHYAGLMFAHRLRRWPNIKQALYQRPFGWGSGMYWVWPLDLWTLRWELICFLLLSFGDIWPTSSSTAVQHVWHDMAYLSLLPYKVKQQ